MKKFYGAVLIVTIFNVSERLLGFFYRIMLSRSIGAEGIGVYQIAVSVFAVLITATSSGVPVTVSRLIAKKRAQNDFNAEYKIVTAGILLCLFLSAPLFLIIIFFRNNLGFLFSDERCLPIFTLLAPILIFNCFYSVIRGFFWGRKQYFPYSIAEFAEEVSMIVTGLVLINLSVGSAGGAVAAGIALMFSNLVSFVFAVILFFAKGGMIKNPKGCFKEIAAPAFSITALRTAGTAVNMLIAVLLPMRLIFYGYTQSEAIALFGASFGMAFPLLFLPSALIGSLALVLVPELSETMQSGKSEQLAQKVQSSIKFTSILSCGVIPFYIIFGKDLGLILYQNEFSGVFLTYAAVLILPMCLSQISTSMLNSLGKEKHTLIGYFASSVLLITAILFLPKYMGVYSLLAGMLLCCTATVVSDFIFLNKTCKIKPAYLFNVLLSAALVIPVTMMGVYTYNILNFIMPWFFASALTVIVTLAFNIGFYLLLNVISPGRFKELFNFHKKVTSNK